MQKTRNTASPLIAHVIFRLGTGGLENGLVNLVNNLPKEKYRHAVICMTDYTHFRERVKREDVEIFCLHKKEGKDFFVFYRLWKLFLRIRPDILHTRNLSALETQLPGYLAGIKSRIHGEHGRDMDDVDGKNIKHTMLRRFYRLLVQRYVPMSKDLESWLIQHIGVKPHKITQIYNGVDVFKFRPVEKKSLDLLPEAFRRNDLLIIGTVGRQENVKDPLTLLNGFIKLLEKYPNISDKCRLVFVGHGRLHNELIEVIQQAGLEDKVWLTGDRNDVAELMQTFDVFVLPSVNEGISNTILEAMATGIPVIATRVGGNSELVVDNQTGYLVPRQNPVAIAEKLKEYLDSPEKIRLHGAMGRAICEERFSLERMLMDYAHVYDEVLQADE